VWSKEFKALIPAITALHQVKQAQAQPYQPKSWKAPHDLGEAHVRQQQAQWQADPWVNLLRAQGPKLNPTARLLQSDPSVPVPPYLLAGYLGRRR
jgi:hypothetical protein